MRFKFKLYLVLNLLFYKKNILRLNKKVDNHSLLLYFSFKLLGIF